MVKPKTIIIFAVDQDPGFNAIHHSLNSYLDAADKTQARRKRWRTYVASRDPLIEEFFSKLQDVAYQDDFDDLHSDVVTQGRTRLEENKR